MVMCVEALAAPAHDREAVKLEGQALVTADGFEPPSSSPLEEGWLRRPVVDLADPPEDS